MPGLVDEVLTLRCGARVRTLRDGGEGGPLLIIVHGMGGSSDSAYMRSLTKKARARGLRPAMVELYNLDYGASPRVFNAGASDALSEIVAQLVARTAAERAVVVGVSLGGCVTLNFAGREVEAHPEVVGVAGISPLVHIASASRAIERWENKLYQEVFLRSLKNVVREHRAALSRHLDVTPGLAARSIREFDAAVTVPLSHYDDVDAYYREASALERLATATRPTLIVHAEDDPIVPVGPTAAAAPQLPSSVGVVITRRGGHVGFQAARRGADVDRRWAENRVLDFAMAALSA